MASRPPLWAPVLLHRRPPDPPLHGLVSSHNNNHCEHFSVTVTDTISKTHVFDSRSFRVFRVTRYEVVPPPIGSYVRVNGELSRVVEHMVSEEGKRHFKATLVDDVGGDIFSEAMEEFGIEIEFLPPIYSLDSLRNNGCAQEQNDGVTRKGLHLSSISYAPGRSTKTAAAPTPRPAKREEALKSLNTAATPSKLPVSALHSTTTVAGHQSRTIVKPSTSQQAQKIIKSENEKLPSHISPSSAPLQVSRCTDKRNDSASIHVSPSSNTVGGHSSSSNGTPHMDGLKGRANLNESDKPASDPHKSTTSPSALGNNRRLPTPASVRENSQSNVAASSAQGANIISQGKRSLLDLASEKSQRETERQTHSIPNSSPSLKKRVLSPSVTDDECMADFVEPKGASNKPSSHKIRKLSNSTSDKKPFGSQSLLSTPQTKVHVGTSLFKYRTVSEGSSFRESDVQDHSDTFGTFSRLKRKKRSSCILERKDMQAGSSSSVPNMEGSEGLLGDDLDGPFDITKSNDTANKPDNRHITTIVRSKPTALPAPNSDIVGNKATPILKEVAEGLAKTATKIQIVTNRNGQSIPINAVVNYLRSQTADAPEVPRKPSGTKNTLQLKATHMTSRESIGTTYVKKLMPETTRKAVVVSQKAQYEIQREHERERSLASFEIQPAPVLSESPGTPFASPPSREEDISVSPPELTPKVPMASSSEHSFNSGTVSEPTGPVQRPVPRKLAKRQSAKKFLSLRQVEDDDDDDNGNKSNDDLEGMVDERRLKRHGAIRVRRTRRKTSTPLRRGGADKGIFSSPEDDETLHIPPKSQSSSSANSGAAESDTEWGRGEKKKRVVRRRRPSMKMRMLSGRRKNGANRITSGTIMAELMGDRSELEWIETALEGTNLIVSLNVRENENVSNRAIVNAARFIRRKNIDELSFFFSYYDDDISRPSRRPSLTEGVVCVKLFRSSNSDEKSAPLLRVPEYIRELALQMSKCFQVRYDENRDDRYFVKMSFYGLKLNGAVCAHAFVGMLHRIQCLIQGYKLTEADVKDFTLDQDDVRLNAKYKPSIGRAARNAFRDGMLQSLTRNITTLRKRREEKDEKLRIRLQEEGRRNKGRRAAFVDVDEMDKNLGRAAATKGEDSMEQVDHRQDELLKIVLELTKNAPVRMEQQGQIQVKTGKKRKRASAQMASAFKRGKKTIGRFDNLSDVDG